MKKKLFTFGLILLIMSVCSTSIYAAGEALRATIYINDEKLDFDAIVAYSGVSMVPFREIFEKCDMKVSWDNMNKTVTASSQDGATVIKLSENKTTAFVNGKSFALSQAPFLGGNTLYVNLRFISESIGATVNFDKPLLSIHIVLPEASIE
ncbi:copper amine oxidase N-terminal domain-containing protein [Paenibacillus polysaccharolyticus]|uniref:copper amine oxidase N-terminal domain-containing protein n=1 Tax=Paenibacillus polysaccharolyticus TaxID=582692 RepID=UPI00203C948C|nr:copper amine oxidase N-terminal domain-containing protein [Paenibacillus polysaccharolyticus]MCM3133754.1 copper amine oxidase N-terminal domain-containing protein [Paenibacillus polysaccharolyticus]